MKPVSVLDSTAPLSVEERAYRRGALQALQFLSADLVNRYDEDLRDIVAKWLEVLVLYRDWEQVSLLGHYMDQVKDAVARRSLIGENTE